MRFLENVTIRAKIALAFAVLLGVTLTLGIVALLRLGEVNQAAATMRDEWLPATRHAGALLEEATRFRQLEAVHIMVDAAAKPREEESLRHQREEYEATWRSFAALISSERERRRAEEAMAAWRGYLQMHERVMGISRAGAT